jgi:hypothetical protein
MRVTTVTDNAAEFCTVPGSFSKGQSQVSAAAPVDFEYVVPPQQSVGLYSIALKRCFADGVSGKPRCPAGVCSTVPSLPHTTNMPPKKVAKNRYGSRFLSCGR